MFVQSLSKLATVFFLIMLVSNTISQVFNRPVPEDFPPFEFQLYDTTYIGSYLFTSAPFKAFHALNRTMSILDKDGYVAWYAADTAESFICFDYDAGNQVFVYVTIGAGNYEAVVLDTNFNRVDSVSIPPGYYADPHEFGIFDNGNYYIVASKDSVMDLSAYTFDGSVVGDSSTSCRGFVVLEIDAATKDIVWEWNSNDHLHPTECIDTTYGYNPSDFDYAHGNSVEEDFDGNLLLSLRHTNSVLKVNRSTGNIMWRLGGKLSDFVLTNDMFGFSGQHDVRRLPNGNIAMFDNMNSKTPPPIRSRALELSLDTVAMTATKVWKHRYIPGVDAGGMGSHQLLPSGHRIISYGRSYRPDPSFILIDDEDTLVSELRLVDTFGVYRARMYDLPIHLPRPDIICDASSGNLVLSVPSGYASYLWSNGETTPSIVVSDTGVYQVWVDHGVGMVGSYPVFVDNTSWCASTDLPSLELEPEGRLLQIYDLLGRPVVRPFVGQLYVIRYENGFANLAQWNEWFEIEWQSGRK